MKDKKLYSTAIIPDELYVHRSADRKLKDVILRMSKPAYISVARQMGKTNLLIQTKRTLENDNNRYVYIDVTNKFESAQDCFRYIINQILNSNEDIAEFREASDFIQRSRQKFTSNPTEEYQNEIREILKRYKGNLVVFLDEVDDLRKHSFSDDIFGQIRKTYFINETYPVLKRITYILSGVIDPEKLIKTKDNSPFNIAIRIYLDDFTFDEFLELVEKSEIVIESEIKKYIYDWLKGNPRMSFEILSLVEDEYIKGNLITEEVVDKVIKEFYLTNFKNPPIDHIRDLIKHNTEVRKALIKLKNGQAKEISDEIINTFYLFGITSTKVDKENICIKNKVIELSLSNDWLDKIELEKKGYFDLGKEKIEEKNYEDGILYLKEYIQNEPKGSLVSLANYKIGEAYYFWRKYQLSNNYLSSKPISIQYSDIYFKQLFYIGVNYLKLKNPLKSQECFKEVINESNYPPLILTSKVNLSEIELLEENTNYHECETLYLQALEILDKNIADIEDSKYYYKIIYFRLGFVSQKIDGKTNIAIDYYKKALQYCNLSEKPILLLNLESCYEVNSSNKIEIYRELSNFIIENEIKFKAIEEIITPFNELQLLLTLSNLLEFELHDDFDSLLNYSLDVLYDNINESVLLNKIAGFSIYNGKQSTAVEIYRRILKLSDVEINIRKTSHQIIGLIAENKQDFTTSQKHLNEYVKCFEQLGSKNSALEIIDFNSFIALIDYHRKNKQYKEAFEIASIIEHQFSEGLNSETKASSAIILFYIMDYFSYIGDIRNTIDYGEKVLNIITEIRPILNEISYVDKKGLDIIEKQTNTILRGVNGIKVIEPIKVIREPGRNEFVKVKYKNGVELTTKYKKVIEDIKKGNCSLIK